MQPNDEAAEILIRVMESMARRMGATLKPATRDDIRRACELLSSAGYEALEDAPRVSPAERAANAYQPAREVIPNYREWKKGRDDETH